VLTAMILPTFEVSYVDGGPVSRRVRDRLVRCRAVERFHEVAARSLGLAWPVSDEESYDDHMRH
jgi:hypothetical protein